MVLRTKFYALAFVLVIFTTFGLQPLECQGQFAVMQNQDIVAMYLYNGQSQKAFEDRVRKTAELRLAAITNTIELDATQNKKIAFALKGDLSRFFKELDDVRTRTKGLNIQDQKDMQKAWQILSPLYERVQNGRIIDENSLMDRVLLETLTEKQREDYLEMQRQRKRKRFEAILKATIVEVEKSMPLLAKQRKELLELLLEQEQPTSVSTGMESYVGFMLMARLPQEKVKGLLDAGQHKVYEKMTERYQGFGGVEWD